MELFNKTIDIQTGEETIRFYTPEEIAEVENEIIATEKRLSLQAETIKARQALLEKLGLTDEEVSLLLG